MRRWTETVNFLDLRHAQRDIALDFRLPDDGGRRRWHVPTAFFDKSPVASDLEVRNAAGVAVSVPTKPQNMAITLAAMAQLNRAGALDLNICAELYELAREVIFNDLFDARVARLVAEEVMGPDDYLLRSLLRALEDRFLLWVPVEGAPREERQLRIKRGQRLESAQLIPKRPVLDDRLVDTARGSVHVEFLASHGHRTLKLPVAVRRLLRVFGVAPISYWHEVTEARRFNSFHLRVVAPHGFLVRDVGVQAPRLGTESLPEPEMREVRKEAGLDFRGRESDVGHLHCSKEVNPPMLLSSTMLGVRGGLTGLWAGAVVFTALLLWAVHRLAPAGISAPGSGQLDATVAVLLVGPTLASVWAIRADSGVVLQRSLLGSRALLLSSAALAVVTALSLAGFQPFHLDNQRAVEIYASLSYAIAALIVICWIATLRVTWFAYRSVLTSARRNFLAVALISLLCFVVVAHTSLPVRVIGFVLLGSGFAFAAIATHPGRATGGFNTLGASFRVAVFGAVGALLGAGYFLGFYDDVIDRDRLQPALLLFEAAVLCLAAVQALRAPAVPPPIQLSSN